MDPHHRQLYTLAETVADGCTECQACVRQCAFLQETGTPKAMAAALLRGEEVTPSPFACSMCGLCTAICPEKLAPMALVLAMRARLVAAGNGILPQHRRIVAYENRGVSHLFSFFALPAGCDTVFFPGCAVAGSRPQRVEQVLERLEERIAHLGIVLDCCSKISHDLGRDDHFRYRFGRLAGFLRQGGVKRVLVACPSCRQIFHEHGADLAVQTVYEVLPPPVPAPVPPCTVAVHDACTCRQAPEVHQAVRRLAGSLGLETREMRHRGRRTLCCGEGGSVPFFRGDLAATWTQKRVAEAGDHPLLTYCAGCTSFLSRRHPRVFHLLDLYCAPHETLAGSIRVSRGLAAYWQRLRLKARLARRFTGARLGNRSAYPLAASDNQSPR